MTRAEMTFFVLIVLTVTMIVTAIFLPSPVEKAWHLMSNPEYEIELASRAAL